MTDYEYSDMVCDIENVIGLESRGCPVSILSKMCIDIIKKITSNTLLISDIDEVVWHFLNDADISREDKKYRDGQYFALRRAFIDHK